MRARPAQSDLSIEETHLEEIAKFDGTLTDEHFAVVLFAEAEEFDLVVQVKYSLPTGTLDVQIRASSASGSIQMVNVGQFTPAQACLAACAAGGLVGPLIECFDRSPKKYLKCLKSKGKSVAADIVKCAIGCAAAAAVPFSP